VPIRARVIIFDCEFGCQRADSDRASVDGLNLRQVDHEASLDARGLPDREKDAQWLGINDSSPVFGTTEIGHSAKSTPAGVGLAVLRARLVSRACSYYRASRTTRLFCV
jgi:hypothetical protein